MNTTANGKPKQRTFRIVFVIEGVPYAVFPVPINPAVGKKAFRLLKQVPEAPASYKIVLDPDGHVSCECPGFESHARCKHVRCLRAARMLD